MPPLTRGIVQNYELPFVGKQTTIPKEIGGRPSFCEKLRPTSFSLYLVCLPSYRLTQFQVPFNNKK